MYYTKNKQNLIQFWSFHWELKSITKYLLVLQVQLKENDTAKYENSFNGI